LPEPATPNLKTSLPLTIVPYPSVGYFGFL